jgi:NADH:ubiquinone reductase (H+-translocating)
VKGYEKMKKPKVVIVGAGFAGIHAAKELRGAPVQVVVLDRNNYHLFQPLLYQVAMALIPATEITFPVRAIFRKQKNFQFRLAEVQQVDFNQRVVQTSNGPVPYDYLILAVGCETNTFDMESVYRNGFGLKDFSDALRIRNHILKTFERASLETNPEALKALRTFVIAGGGPTGVECAGALSELIQLTLAKDFPDMDLRDIRVILLEMTDRLLAGFPPELAKAAASRLQKKQVEICFGADVVGYDGEQVLLRDGGKISTKTLIWTAGVRASNLMNRVGLQQARQGRVWVDPTLQSPDHPEVFICGDAAYLEKDGQSLPMLAPVAIQQGKTAARNIQRILSGQQCEPFEYHDPGSLATIGRHEAVARVNIFKFHGFLAWVVWLVVHLFWLIGFRNRLIVLISWAWDYLFYESAVRLITPELERDPSNLPAANLAKPVGYD